MKNLYTVFALTVFGFFCLFQFRGINTGDYDTSARIPSRAYYNPSTVRSNPGSTRTHYNTVYYNHK
ncbi:MAG: hypothetical protein KC910_10615 [Candidatus Eremiobacteraeota bacterium]|nr:hypothetical protein [Candidatus Eremiobacteraeota bacterium]